MSIYEKENAILQALSNLSTTVANIAQTQTEMSQALAALSKAGGAQFDPSQLLALATDADDNSKALLDHVSKIEALIGQDPTSAPPSSGSGSTGAGTAGSGDASTGGTGDGSTS